ncbi:OmpW family outer membrane protein [Paucibacter sp. APW11]|uniref:OmpW family outer membrane protein n=1 Tax=Roseateles aquae TaxID=3077235 RepID=A0ABU3PAW6_9BURK|nr:OmpW family outer membrane protein [Paucibacter sp. APW11]MDT8999665.1 OmpW family outer membrane protein [Paucibacter sp. APW11]
MNKFAARTLTAVAIACTAVAVQAAEGPWGMRVRAVNIDSANKDSTGLGLTINNKVIPEVDFSYYFSPNLAAELILTYPQKHTLSSNGTEIGTLKHLPPTLSLQYHFAPNDAFRPYIGAGINYTIFSNVEFAPAVDAALSPSVKHTSLGLSFQIGFDYELSKNLYLNVDLKKAQIGTKVYSKGTEVGTFKVDPLLIGVGLGFRF